MGLTACPDNVDHVESVARSFEAVVAELRMSAQQEAGHQREVALSETA